MLGLAAKSTEAAEDRFAISVETVGSRKIGEYLAMDRESSKALMHSGRLFLHGLWEVLSTRQLAEAELRKCLFVAVGGLALFADANFTIHDQASSPKTLVTSTRIRLNRILNILMNISAEQIKAQLSSIHPLT